MIPVTILNGFLGAGKTTLLQSLLVQARGKPVRLGVIVNEMSALDVDGAILDTTEVISRRDPRFAAISAGSISGPAGLTQFTDAVERITAGGATHILIETSGSTHPWPLLRAIQRHPALRLHGFLSVVDTITLAQDHDMGRAIHPAASAHLAAGLRGVENLLAEQIMFASRILLSKTDRVTPAMLQTVAQAIHPLNRHADIMGMQWGNVRLHDVLALPAYDHARVETLGKELTDWDRKHGTDSMTGQSGITSVVIDDPRPMHPQRLWDAYNTYLGTGIHRSKGFFWMPSRDSLQLLWNQTAGSIGLEILNYWKIAALKDLNLMPEERAEMQGRLARQHPDFGDRRTRLTVIGDVGLATFADALQDCLCTPSEVEAWKRGASFDDPWPTTTRSLT